jgi:Leucine-rich repeat (LRR) protein
MSNEELTLRCPEKGCIGWVSFVKPGSGESFWGCGECGTPWRTRDELNAAIDAILAKRRYRRASYVPTPAGWSAASLDDEHPDYEELVEKEIRSKTRRGKQKSDLEKRLDGLGAYLKVNRHGQVTEIDWSNYSGGDADLDVFEGLSELEWLVLSSERITDSGLVHLAGLRKLKKLEIERAPISDAGLGHLAELSNLESLTICRTDITDSGLKHLTGLRHLQYLRLESVNVGDKGLAHLVSLTELKYLFLDDTKVSDAGLKHLGRLTALERLFLSGTQVTDKGLRHLENLKRLSCLNLDMTQVTDAGAAKLRSALRKCDISSLT